MREFLFTRRQVGEAMDLLGLPGPGHESCPVREAAVSAFDGGRQDETALTVVAEDCREAVAVAMQLAALVCDGEEVADMHTRLVFGADARGCPRLQFRGYHLQSAAEALAEGPLCEAAEPSPAA